MKRVSMFFLVVALAPGMAGANETVDAAIGGGVGGTLGAAVGSEVAGRDGAIVGAGVGAALGAAVATDDQDRDGAEKTDRVVVVPVEQNQPFCPPGQAKKGRC